MFTYKRTVTPLHAYADIAGRRKYSSCLFATRHWKEVGSPHHAPAAVPRETPGTHCTEGWLGLGAGLDSTENLASSGIRSPDRLACTEPL
jgi:hypothetical protein